MKSFLLALMTLLSAHSLWAFLNGSVPLPEHATGIYPYNTVGMVSNDSGWMGSGCAVGKRTVLTAAHIFYDDELHVWNNQPYTWNWNRSPANSTDEGVAARSWIHFEDYASLVDAADRGGASLEPFNKDIYILQFLEDITTQIPSKWTSDAITNLDYKMILGYPAGYYEFWQRERNMMHATHNAEPVVSEFTSMFADEVVKQTTPNRRLYQSSGLRSTSGNSGGPLFAFINDVWTLVGVYVGSNGALGYSIFVGIDEDVKNMIDQALAAENPDQTIVYSYPVYDPVTYDLNGNWARAQSMTKNTTHLSSIFPVGDADYFSIPVAEGNQEKFFVMSTFPAKVQLYDFTYTLIQEQTLAANFYTEFNLSTVNGQYYAVITANAPTGSIGHYAYGIIDGANNATHVDRLSSTFAMYPMPLNSQMSASLRYDIPNDYFSFDVQQAGRLIIQSDGPLNTVGLLGQVAPTATLPYQISDFTSIIDLDADSSKSGDFQIEADLQPGQYVLLTEAQYFQERGYYSVSSKFIPRDLGSLAADTDFNELFKNADHSRFLSYEEKIDEVGDIDFRSFRTRAPGTVTINVTSTLTHTFELFNANFDQFGLVADQDVVKTATGYTITKYLPEGSYYIRISAIESGDYTIDFGFDLVEGFWTGFAGAQDGEKTLAWFGTFSSESTKMGWIEHNDHGRIYVKGASTEDFWIWDPAIGLWFRTSEATYPNLLDPIRNIIYRYIQGTKNPRQFENTVTLEVINEGDLPK
ncbi:MAG: trypsin-like peptidase domain-containing protein [Opitutales bacterium]|nr:trypsin-like peptidase domain-containing protein [Opitutales bacterium]